MEIMERVTEDYGHVKLSQEFFDKNPLVEISAPRLLYSFLSYPGMDQLAAETVRKFIPDRGKKEEERIRKETQLENLIKIMEQTPDPINQPLLVKKIVSYRKKAIPIIIEKLKDTQDDVFIELAIRIIYHSKVNCSNQLLEILDSIKAPYAVSLVCLLLGLIGKKDAIQPVWNYYHYLKKRYCRQNYEQGPLIALYEFKERFSL